MKNKIYTVNLTCTKGTVTRIISEESESPTLEEAQEFIGGYVEMAPILGAKSLDPVQLLVNDEGLLRDLPLNPNASLTAGYDIYGNAIVLKGKALWK